LKHPEFGFRSAGFGICSAGLGFVPKNLDSVPGDLDFLHRAGAGFGLDRCEAQISISRPISTV
jgi:hypothetical protein